MLEAELSTVMFGSILSLVATGGWKKDGPKFDPKVRYAYGWETAAQA